MQCDYVTKTEFQAALQEMRDRFVTKTEFCVAIERLEVKMEIGFADILGKLGAAESRLRAIENSQMHIKRELIDVSDNGLAVYNDVKELYAMSVEIKQAFGKQLKQNRNSRQRMLKIEAFNRDLAIRTGIPYPE